MSLFLVNVLLAVGIAVAMVAAVLTLRLWTRRKYREAIGISIKSLGLIDAYVKAHAATRRELSPEVQAVLEKERKHVSELKEEASRALVASLRWLNVLTTIVGVVPLGFAVYNIVTDNQTQALTFNLVSLATVLVTKGGLFLLTLVLIPMLKAVPAGVGTTFGGIIAHKLWKRVEARRKPKPSE